MGGSSPSVERFACGSSLFASGAVTVSLYLAKSSVRTRGHRVAGRCRGRLLSPRTPIAAAPARARRQRAARPRAGGTPGTSPTPRGSRRLRLGPAPRWDMHSHMHGSSAKLVGSCDAAARRRPGRAPGRPERSRRGGAPSSRLYSASAGRGRGHYRIKDAYLAPRARVRRREDVVVVEAREGVHRRADGRRPQFQRVLPGRGFGRVVEVVVAALARAPLARPAAREDRRRFSSR